MVPIATAAIALSCAEGGDGGPFEAENQDPRVAISAPTDGATFNAGEGVMLTGQGIDFEDGALTGDALVWQSDRMGELGTGATLNRDDLEPGSHQITLTGTDSEGATGTDAIEITVMAAASGVSASIASPEHGAIYTAGDPITFAGSGTDPDGNPLTGAALVWTSDRDGELGTGDSFVRSDLSVGKHAVTLIATDADGGTASAGVTITVEETSSAGMPLVDIASPAMGDLFMEGGQVSFAGSADDPEDGALTGASLVWTSDVDGELGTGETFQRFDLSPGKHEITLTATDADGESARDSVGVQVGFIELPAFSIEDYSDDPGGRTYFHYALTDAAVDTFGVYLFVFAGVANMYIRYGAVPTLGTYDCVDGGPANTVIFHCDISNPALGDYFFMLAVPGPESSFGQFNPRRVTVTGAPDLVVEAIRISPSPVTYGDYAAVIEVDVRNDGEGPTGCVLSVCIGDGNSFHIGFSVDGESIISTGNRVEPGETVTVSKQIYGVSVGGPAPPGPGHHTLEVVLDPLDEEEEMDEGNNTASIQFEVVSG